MTAELNDRLVVWAKWNTQRTAMSQSVNDENFNAHRDHCLALWLAAGKCKVL